MTDQTTGLFGSGVALVVTIGFIVAGIVLYFVPTIIAAIRRKENTAAIAVLNLLLGWTFIGWVVALVWAVSTQLVDAKPKAR